MTVSQVIEIERDRLYELVDEYGLGHPLVIEQSQLLDKLILPE